MLVQIHYDRSTEIFKQGSDDLSDFFGDFASYYGFGLKLGVACRSRSKGIIERLFDYVQKSFHTVDAATFG